MSFNPIKAIFLMKAIHHRIWRLLPLLVKAGPQRNRLVVLKWQACVGGRRQELSSTNNSTVKIDPNCSITLNHSAIQIKSRIFIKIYNSCVRCKALSLGIPDDNQWFSNVNLIHVRQGGVLCDLLHTAEQCWAMQPWTHQMLLIYIESLPTVAKTTVKTTSRFHVKFQGTNIKQGLQIYKFYDVYDYFCAALPLQYRQRNVTYSDGKYID